jgi:uncharacterized protein YhhL (DUF1145 family)
MIHKEIMGRLNWVNAYYQSIKNISYSLLLPKNVKNRIYVAMIFLVVLHGCETWVLRLREEHRQSV